MSREADRALRARLMAAAEAGVQRWLAEEQGNNQIKLGGVTMSGPGRLKVQVVDAEFKSHTYVLVVEEKQA